jgi:hypothetical protein
MNNKKYSIGVTLLTFGMIFLISSIIYNRFINRNGSLLISIIIIICAVLIIIYEYIKASKDRKYFKNEPGKFFNEVKLEINGKHPDVRIEDFVYKGGQGFKLTVDMPAGMSSNDFLEKKLAMEEYYNADISIFFKEKLIILITPKPGQEIRHLKKLIG